VLPIAYAGQVLARFLIERVALPPDEDNKMRSAFKQLDEITVVIETSLSHAVRAHDPRKRDAVMMAIRRARAKGGNRGARAVVRSMTAQQAFYPRAWAQWLGQAARDGSTDPESE
jgi:hypothetical protein